MRLVCLSTLSAFLFACGVNADEPADRAAIEKVVSTLDSPVRPSVDISHEPWGEATITLPPSHPVIVIHGIRFVTPDVALIEATNGSLPVLIVMKKEGEGWRLISQHVLAQP